MGLFTVPLVISDGSANRTYDFIGQQSSEGSSLVGKYLETATSTSAIDAAVVKHATLKTSRRDLLQKSINLPILDGTLKPIVINLTITAHNEHADAVVEKEVKLLLAMAGTAGFTGKMRKGYL